MLLSESDPARAAELAEQAVAGAPDDPKLLDTLGTALLAAGDSSRARQHLRRAYALSR